MHALCVKSEQTIALALKCWFCRAIISERPPPICCPSFSDVRAHGGGAGAGAGSHRRLLRQPLHDPRQRGETAAPPACTLGLVLLLLCVYGPRDTFLNFSVSCGLKIGDETFIIAALMAMRHPKSTVLSGALSALFVMTVGEIEAFAVCSSYLVG